MVTFFGKFGHPLDFAVPHVFNTLQLDRHHQQNLIPLWFPIWLRLKMGYTQYMAIAMAIRLGNENDGLESELDNWRLDGFQKTYHFLCFFPWVFSENPQKPIVSWVKSQDTCLVAWPPGSELCGPAAEDCEDLVRSPVLVAVLGVSEFPSLLSFFNENNMSIVITCYNYYHYYHYWITVYYVIYYESLFRFVPTTLDTIGI